MKVTVVASILGSICVALFYLTIGSIIPSWEMAGKILPDILLYSAIWTAFCFVVYFVVKAVKNKKA